MRVGTHELHPGQVQWPPPERFCQRSQVVTSCIGPCVAWPGWVTSIFWSTRLNTTNATHLMAFCLGNGLPCHLLHQWLCARGVKFTFSPPKIYAIEERLLLQTSTTVTLCNSKRVGHQRFFFDLAKKEYRFLNGSAPPAAYWNHDCRSPQVCMPNFPNFKCKSISKKRVKAMSKIST